MLLGCCTQNFSTNIEEGCRQFWRVLFMFLTFALHRLSDDTGIYFSESLNAKMRLTFVSTTYDDASGKSNQPLSCFRACKSAYNPFSISCQSAIIPSVGSSSLPINRKSLLLYGVPSKFIKSRR